MQTEVETNDFTRFSPLCLCTFLLYNNVYVEATTPAFDGQGLDLAIEISTIPVGKIFLAYLNSINL